MSYSTVREELQQSSSKAMELQVQYVKQKTTMEKKVKQEVDGQELAKKSMIKFKGWLNNHL